MKTVTVLLTKYSDFISWVVCRISGNGYTHSSLSLEENAGKFYSFNYHGFCIETPAKHRRRGVKTSLCYELSIPDEAYEGIRKRIQLFETNIKDYHYTRLGVLFAAFQIPFHWKNHYICSQFVAELLKESGAVPLKKKSCKYLPNQFCNELEQYERVKNILYAIYLTVSKNKTLYFVFTHKN